MAAGDDTWENIAELNEKHLRVLAKDIGNEWQQLATYLDIKDAHVSKIKADYPGNTNEQIFQMLMMWKRGQAVQGSDLIDSLRAAFDKVDRKDLAEKLRGCPVPKSPQSDCFYCAEHVGNIKQYYCETCQKMICEDCVRSYHLDQEHATYDIREISDRYRQNLRDQIQLVDTERQTTERDLQALEKVERGFNREMDHALENIKEAAAKLIKEVEAKRKQAIDEFENLRASRSHSFEDERAEQEKQLKRLSEKIEDAKQVTKQQPDNKFLLQYPAALEKLKKPVGAPSKMQAQLSYPMFLEGPSVFIDLGKVVMVNTWKLVHTIGRKGDGEGEFEGARGIAAAKPDKIAVTDRKNGRVVICNSQGNNWKSISVAANDVAAIPKRWVIANPTVVQLYKKEDAEYVSEFKTVSEDEQPRRVNLIAVAVKTNGNIIVGDGMQVLTEHSPDGSILRTIRVKIKPFFLAVMQDQRFGQLVELIAISDLTQPTVFIIEVSDTDVATTVGEIHPILDGKPAMDCRGMCADDSGIYIAATTKTYNKCHVHHYDTRGRFIACVAKDLYNPYGLTFTADGQRLAVADCQSVKIYEKV